MANKMTLDEEMQLWETRSNDKFGSLIKSIEKELDGYFLNEETDYGTVSNPVHSILTSYELDGDMESCFNSVCYFLQMYDYCNLKHPTWSNHPSIARMIRKFAKTNNLTIKFIEF